MRSARRRKVLAAVLGLLGAGLVAEGVCRIDAIFPGKVYSAGAMRTFLESRAAATNYGDQADFAVAGPGLDPNEHRPVPDPWSGWTSPALIRRVAQGSNWFHGNEHERTFDVVLLGGSFAAQFGNYNNERLRSWLADVPEVGSRPVEIWNLSVAAQKQPSHLNRLIGVLALGWKPDLVVCIDGYNELAVSVENAAVEAHPVYPSVAFWSGMARAGDVDTKALDLLVEMRAAQLRIAARAQSGLRFGVWRSALLSRAWSAWISLPQADFRAARERHMAWLGSERSQIAIRGPTASLDPSVTNPARTPVEAGVDAGVTAWADAARNLRAICDRRGLPLVHAIQPGLDDIGSKPASDEEKRTNVLLGRWRESIQTGYPRLRASLAELAREGIEVRDGSRCFTERTETLYVDGCHLNNRGYELFGLEVVGWIRSTLSAR